jgi:HD superfamily phosphohydrolase YqeK
MVIARDVFAVRDSAVLSAIECHTTLKSGASVLDKVVFLADKIAWDQPGTPPYIVQLTQALDRSLDKAVWVYLDHLWQRRATLQAIHPWFVRAYRELSDLVTGQVRQTAE